MLCRFDSITLSTEYYSSSLLERPFSSKSGLRASFGVSLAGMTPLANALNMLAFIGVLIGVILFPLLPFESAGIKFKFASFGCISIVSGNDGEML